MKIKKQRDTVVSDATYPGPDVIPQGDNKDIRRGKPSKKLSKLTIWTINITVITFVLSGFFTVISELTTSTAHISVAFVLLLLLVVINIVFDAIGVAATSCELAPLLSMASRRIKGSQVAIKLVKNAERVSNICCDVIGDICGIVSGSCTLAIVINITINIPDKTSFWISVIFSSVIAALTVGGKAIFKEISIKHSRDIILLVSRMLSVFIKKQRP